MRRIDEDTQLRELKNKITDLRAGIAAAYKARDPTTAAKLRKRLGRVEVDLAMLRRTGENFER